MSVCETFVVNVHIYSVEQPNEQFYPLLSVVSIHDLQLKTHFTDIITTGYMTDLIDELTI